MEEITVAAPSLVYLNANKSFSGSCGGMWYRLGMEGDVLRACVWPLPWCFEKTDEAAKTFADFAPDTDGLAAARAWIAGQYEQQRPRCRRCSARMRQRTEHKRKRRGGS